MDFKLRHCQRDSPGYKETAKKMANFSFQAFSRKWTKLDLLSMARRRDFLTKNLAKPSCQPLELDYVSVYADFSSLVHCSVAAFSDDFLESKYQKSKIVLTPKPNSSRLLVLLLAMWDVLQVVEMLKKLQISCDSESNALLHRLSNK